MMIRLVLIVFAVLQCNAHPWSPECELEEGAVAALRSLIHERDWSQLTPDKVARIWSNETPWGERTASTLVCDGTLTLSHLAAVLSDKCYCCDTFLYSQSKAATDCHETLTSITVVRAAAHRRDAQKLAARFAAAVGVSLSAESHASGFVTEVRHVTPQVTETISIVTTKIDRGWTTRLEVYRLTVPST
jgi:hypothetical protein